MGKDIDMDEYGIPDFMEDVGEISEACKRRCIYAERQGERTLMRATEDLMYQLALVASVVTAKKTSEDGIRELKGLMGELIEAMWKRREDE